MGHLHPLSGGDRRQFRVTSPVDGSEVTCFTVETADEVRRKVARARSAQVDWAKVSVKERGKRMQRLLSLIVKRQEAIVERLTKETGRPELDTLMIEIFAACDCANYYGRRAHKVLSDQKVRLHLMKMKRCTLTWEPYGVVGVISPWNGPFILSISPTIQAVLAGNAVVIKPSEVTPSAGLLVEELFRDAGFPEGLVQVTLGDGETGAALLDAGVDKVTFTGSVRTGRIVGETCGRNLIPCTLELGGKDPMIVCADADLDRAAGGALFGGLMNNGQFCSGIERIYVVESVAEAFIEKVVANVAELEHGRDLGPFIFEPQGDIVERQVKDAVDKGATVRIGGTRNGNYFAATVLTDITHEMLLMQDETFGPILPICVVRDEDDAIEKANDSLFGLSASIWTADTAKAQRMARRIRAGSVTINETSLVYGAIDVPFGGVRNSGVGQVNGAEGLKNYAVAKPILSDIFGSRAEQVWFPYTPEKAESLKKALGVLWGSPLRWFL